MTPGRLLIALLPGFWFGQACKGPGETPRPSAIAQAAQEPAPPAFVPVVTLDDGFDWIQLTSGEWLKGELIDMRDGTLEFDSEELGDLSFDIEDVALLRTAAVQTVHFEEGENMTGTVSLKDGLVTVEGHSGGRAPREHLMSIVPGSGSRRSQWSGKISPSLTIRSGNTTQTDLSSYVFLRHQTPRTRWDTTYNGAFSKANGLETANNNRLNSTFDYFLTRRLFVTPLAVTAFQDRFTNLDLRLTPSARLGYDLLDRDKLSWEVGGGPAYEYTRFSSAPAGESNEEKTAALLLNTAVEWDIVNGVDFKLGYEVTVPMPERHNYSFHLSSMLSLDVLSWLDVDLAFIWDRTNRPQADDLDTTPDPNDFKFTLGFGIEF